MKKFIEGGGGNGCRWFLGSMVIFENWCESCCIVDGFVEVQWRDWCWFITYIRCLCFMVCLFCVLFTHNSLCRTVTSFSSRSHEWVLCMNKSRHKPNSNVLLGSGCGMLLLDSCSFPLVWLTMNAADMFMMDGAAKTCLWLTVMFLYWFGVTWYVDSLQPCDIASQSIRCLGRPHFVRYTGTLQKAVTICFRLHLCL